MNEFFSEVGIVGIFQVEKPWIYVKVPQIYTEMSKHMATRGLVPIVARVGKTEWQTSLLPFGDGTHFLAINSKLRKKEGIEVGDKINFEFKFR